MSELLVASGFGRDFPREIYIFASQLDIYLCSVVDEAKPFDRKDSEFLFRRHGYLEIRRYSELTKGLLRESRFVKRHSRTCPAGFS